MGYQCLDRGVLKRLSEPVQPVVLDDTNQTIDSTFPEKVRSCVLGFHYTCTCSSTTRTVQVHVHICHMYGTLCLKKPRDEDNPYYMYMICETTKQSKATQNLFLATSGGITHNTLVTKLPRELS